MKIIIEESCFKSSHEDCAYLKNRWSKLKTWIKENELHECAIVKYAENNCTETNTLECDEDYCSDSKNIKESKYASQVGFWFKDEFEVTSFNLKSVKTSAHLKRFTCIKPDETEGVEVGGVCIRNLNLAKRLSSDILKFEFVIKYLAKNLKNYTQLPIEVAELIDYKNLPDGTQIYSKYGTKVDSYPGEEVYVLPSKPTVTKEAISWMRHDKKMSDVICNSFGLRIFTTEQMEVLPQKDPHVDCFYNDEGKKLEKKEDIVWAFGEDVGTTDNKLKISDNLELMFALKVRDFLFLKETKSIPTNGIHIGQNIIIKKTGSRVVEGPIDCKKLTQSPIFKNFERSDFVITNCLSVPKGDHPAIEGYYIFSKYATTQLN